MESGDLNQPAAVQGDNFDNFIVEMLAEKQLPGVTDEVRAQLVEDLKVSLLDQIDRALIEALPDSKVGQLSDMLDDPTTDNMKLRQFILDAGVDVLKVTTETMVRFRELYVRSQSQEV